MSKKYWNRPMSNTVRLQKHPEMAFALPASNRFLQKTDFTRTFLIFTFFSRKLLFEI